MLPAIRISIYADNGGAAPDAALIMLHGLGSSPEDFRGAVNSLDLPDAARIEVVVPQAPMLPVTINGGHTMPAWYDILSIRRGSGEDAEGIRRACGEIDEVIADLNARGIVHRRIILGGFSQGGALALYYASRASEALAGVAALSAYMPLIDDLARAATPPGRATPVLMSHGIYDEIVPLDFAHASRKALERADFEVTWREYPLGHSLNAQVLADLSRWLAPRLTSVQPSSR